MARILAKALNCEKGPTATPCGTCASCLEIARGAALDVIEIDGASNTSVNDVREIRDEVLFAPQTRPVQGLHHRRGAHALQQRLQRAAEDDRGAAAVRGVHLRHHGGAQGPGHHPLALPAVQLPAHLGRGDPGQAARGRHRARRAGRGQGAHLDREGGDRVAARRLHAARPGGLVLGRLRHPRGDPGEARGARHRRAERVRRAHRRRRSGAGARAGRRHPRQGCFDRAVHGRPGRLFPRPAVPQDRRHARHPARLRGRRLRAGGRGPVDSAAAGESRRAAARVLPGHPLLVEPSVRAGAGADAPCPARRPRLSRGAARSDRGAAVRHRLPGQAAGKVGTGPSALHALRYAAGVRLSRPRQRRRHRRQKRQRRRRHQPRRHREGRPPRPRRAPRPRRLPGRLHPWIRATSWRA